MADINQIIKDLGKSFDGSNEEQMAGVQMLKGLATSDDPKANEFMKAIDKATSEISKDMTKEESKKEERFVDSKLKAKDFFKLH